MHKKEHTFTILEVTVINTHRMSTHPCFNSRVRISGLVRFLFTVSVSINRQYPAGPLPSYRTFSTSSPFTAPFPVAIAFSTVCLGIPIFRARESALESRKLVSGLSPACRIEEEISTDSFAYTLLLDWSAAALARFIFDHLLCPAAAGGHTCKHLAK